MIDTRPPTGAILRTAIDRQCVDRLSSRASAAAALFQAGRSAEPGTGRVCTAVRQRPVGPDRESGGPSDADRTQPADRSRTSKEAGSTDFLFRSTRAGMHRFAANRHGGSRRWICSASIGERSGPRHQKNRRVFLMHRLRRLTYKQIATQLGISTPAVEYHMMQALVLVGLRLLRNNEGPSGRRSEPLPLSSNPPSRNWRSGHISGPPAGGPPPGSTSGGMSNERNQMSSRSCFWTIQMASGSQFDLRTACNMLPPVTSFWGAWADSAAQLGTPSIIDNER